MSTENGKNDSDEKVVEIMEGMVEVEIDPLTRAKKALEIACQNIAALNDRNARLTEALHKALALQDALLTELSVFQRKAQTPPSLQLLAAKNNFDAAMKVLLSHPDS